MDNSAHRERVDRIAAAVRGREPGTLVRAGKAGSHTPYGNLAGYGAAVQPRYAAVDLNGLTQILSIDAKAGLVTVEGGVQMGALCRELLALGLLPAVCPEGEAFTIAGLINGFGIQSSSHRYGLFHDIVAELEVVTGDGRVLRASASAHADLFALISGSFGTLGLVTAATLQCMRAAPRVRTVGLHFTDADAFSAAMLRALRGAGREAAAGGGGLPPPGASGAPPDPCPTAAAFVEGYSFGRHSFVLLEADFEGPPGSMSGAAAAAAAEEYCPGPGDPYYYQYVCERAVAAGTQSRFAFSQSTFDYVFRHNRGVWWLLEHHLGAPFVTGTSCGRRLLSAALKPPASGARAPERGWQPRPGIAFSHADYARCLVTQGFYVRQSRLGAFLSAVHDTLGILPLWTCPVRVFSTATPTAAEGVAESSGRLWRRLRGDGGGGSGSGGVGWCYDVGCYGTPTARSYRAFSTVRALQGLADSPSQWGLSYMTREEMQRGEAEGGVLDAAAYRAARRAYGAEGAFPPLWDKVGAYDPGGGGGASDGPIIRCWRLKRDGLCECCASCAVAAAALVAILVYALLAAGGGFY